MPEVIMTIVEDIFDGLEYPVKSDALNAPQTDESDVIDLLTPLHALEPLEPRNQHSSLGRHHTESGDQNSVAPTFVHVEIVDDR